MTCQNRESTGAIIMDILPHCTDIPATVVGTGDIVLKGNKINPVNPVKYFFS